MHAPSPEPSPAPPRARARPPRWPWAAALAWLAALLLLLAAFAFVGEEAWPVVLLLYLPRLPWILPGLLLLPLALRRGRRALLLPLAAGALIWLFPLMGFVPPRLPARPAGPTFRVLSYNTGHAVDGVESLRALVRGTGADLVLFQWTSHEAEAALRGPGFEGWTVRRAGQFTVASRFPVRSIEAVGFPAPPDGALPCAHAVVESPLGTVDVYAMRPKSARIELAARRKMGLRHRVAEFVEDLESGRLAASAALRESQTRSVAAEAARARHLVLIAGDSNLPGGSRLLRTALGGYRDAFAEAGWGFGYSYPARLPWMRLDRVLLGPGLRAVSFAVQGRRVSGHRAILAEIAGAPAR